MRSSFGRLRVLYWHLGKPVVGVQSEQEKIIFDDIFLGRPAMNIGLGKFHRIDGLSLLCGHNGNEPGCRLFGRSCRRLPAVAPPSPLIKGQVFVPARRVLSFLRIWGNWNAPAQVADEGYLQAQGVVRMVFTRQADASRSHFADDVSVGVCAQRHKGSHLREGGEIPILRGLQDRDHGSALRMQTGQKLCGHPFSIHNDSLDLGTLLAVFIARKDGGQSHGQMLIPSMRCSQKGMPLLVMKQHQCPAAQDHSQASDQSTGNEHFAVDGLTMSVYVTRERLRFPRIFSFWMPEIGRPPRQGIREAFCAARLSDL
jgi:hypothetical protein